MSEVSREPENEMGAATQEIGRGAPPDDDEIPEYQEPTKALAVVPAREASEIERRQMSGGLLRLVAPVAEVLSAQNELRALIADALKDGRDYGKVPGVAKKFLFKAGAERVNGAYGLAARFRVLEQEVDHDRINEYVKKEWHPTIRGQKVDVEGTSKGLYRYVVACELVDRRTGIVVGEGLGSCSTMESKYIDRPRDLENTALKMGKKRAYVDATLTTHGLSDEFTQDEDVVQGANGHAAAPAFDADAPIGFGKHKELSWRQACEDKGEESADWVYWAIGRKDGKGADRLKGDERKAVSALFDEVQGKTSRAPTEQDHGKNPGAGYPDPTAPAALEPLNRLIGSGKHPELTWLQLIDQHPEYAQKAVDAGWCKLKKSENAELLAAVREELAMRRGGRPAAASPDQQASAQRSVERERVRLDEFTASDEAQQVGVQPGARTPGEHEAEFLALMRDAGVNVERWRVIGEAHPKLPDEPMEWVDDHYRIALETVRQFGVQDALYRCDVRVRRARGLPMPVAPTEGRAPALTRNINPRDREKAEGLLTQGRRLKIDGLENYEAVIAQALQDDSPKLLAGVTDELQVAVFRTMGTAPQGDLLA